MLILLVAAGGGAYADAVGGAIRPTAPSSPFGAFAPSSRAPTLCLSTREEFKPNGSLRVMVDGGRGWQLAGVIPEDEFLRSRSLDL
jgi:hypothetical protein